MPTIVDIEDNLSVSLTEISTMVYGYRNNFCMDLGTINKITVKYERVNPFPYDDSSDDPEKWSNGKWFTHLEELLDFWQNLGLDYKDGEWRVGFTFTYSSEDESLFPSFVKNVFMVGSLNRTYVSTQKLAFTLPMTVSSMSGTTSQAETVTLTLRTENANAGGYVEEKVIVLKGYDVSVPPCPSGWEQYQPGRAFVGWKASDDSIYDMNDTHTWLKDDVLTARWEGAMTVSWFNISGEYTVDIPEGASNFIAYLVGAGGGAGGCRWNQSGSGSIVAYKAYSLCGGGGGAGEVKITGRTRFESGAIIKLTVGEGGTGGTNRGMGVSLNATNGGNGGDTFIKVNDVEYARARGGDGGKAATSKGVAYAASAGGVNYREGGSTFEDGSGGDGVDGASELVPIEDDFYGKGGRPCEYKVDNVSYFKQGGAGGASAPFRYRFLADDGWHPSNTAYYESVGGHGRDCNNEFQYATSGMYGGGGGSGWLSDDTVSSRGGVGGTGCALILWFR